MTTISNTNSLSTLLAQSLATANKGTAKSSSIGSSLLAAVEQELSGSANSTGSVADLVSLGGSAQTNQATTYNAQGLLSQVQSALISNDPLLQDTGASATGGTLDSLLATGSGNGALESLLGGSTGSSSLDSGTLLQTLLAGQTAGGAGSSSNTALSQAFSQNPSLASDLAQAAVSQSIFSALP